MFVLVAQTDINNLDPGKRSTFTDALIASVLAHPSTCDAILSPSNDEESWKLECDRFIATTNALFTVSFAAARRVEEPQMSAVVFQALMDLYLTCVCDPEKVAPFRDTIIRDGTVYALLGNVAIEEMRTLRESHLLHPMILLAVLRQAFAAVELPAQPPALS